jgi:hypothetical protein
MEGMAKGNERKRLVYIVVNLGCKVEILGYRGWRVGLAAPSFVQGQDKHELGCTQVTGNTHVGYRRENQRVH